MDYPEPPQNCPPSLRHFFKKMVEAGTANRPVRGIGTYPSETPGGTQIHSFASAEQSNASFPWRMLGYKRNNKSYISFDYAEVNQVEYSALSPGKYYEFLVTDAGVLYITIQFDSTTYEVVSWWPSLAVDDESIPENTDDGTYIYASVLIGQFYLNDNNLPIPYNIERENLNISLRPTIATDGRYCIEIFKTYLLNTMARDSIDLEVYNPDDTNQPSMYLVVNDSTPANDKLLFTYGGGTLQFKWIDGSGNGNPEAYIQNAATAYSSLKADSWMLADALSSPTHSIGFHPGYLDIDAGKTFLGFKTSDSDYVLTLTSNNGSHGVGLYPGYLNFDSGKTFVGFDTSDSTYKVSLSDSSNGCGLHPAYLEFNSNVYLGYTSGKYQLTITDGTNAVGLESNALIFNGSTVVDNDGFYAVDNGVYKIGSEAVIDKNGFYCYDGDTGIFKVDENNYFQKGKVVVEDSVLTDGDLNLGSTGTVTINGMVFQPSQIADCSGNTLWVLADSSGWQAGS